MRHLVVILIMSLLILETTTVQSRNIIQRALDKIGRGISRGVVLDKISDNKNIIRALETNSRCSNIRGRAQAMHMTISYPTLQNTGGYSDISESTLTTNTNNRKLPRYQGRVQFGEPVKEEFTILPIDITHISGHQYRIRYISQATYNRRNFLYERGEFLYYKGNGSPFSPNDRPSEVQEAIIVFTSDNKILWNPSIKEYHYQDHSPQSVYVRPVVEDIRWGDGRIRQETAQEEVSETTSKVHTRRTAGAAPLANNCVLKELVSFAQGNETSQNPPLIIQQRNNNTNSRKASRGLR